jgi:hypothetical protein
MKASLAGLHTQHPGLLSKTSPVLNLLRLADGTISVARDQPLAYPLVVRFLLREPVTSKWVGQ